MTEFSTRIARVASRNAAIRALLGAGWPWTIFAGDYFELAAQRAEELSAVTPDLSEELRLAKERIAQLELLLQGDEAGRKLTVPQTIEHYAILVQPRPQGPNTPPALLMIHSAGTLSVPLPDGFVFANGNNRTTFERLFDFVTGECRVRVISKDGMSTGFIPIGRWLRPANSDPNSTLGGFLNSVSMMMLQVPALWDARNVIIEVPLFIYRRYVAEETRASSTLTITFAPYVFTS